jgi:hypothetical protein
MLATSQFRYQSSSGFIVLISGFCCNVDGVCALLGCYKVLCGNCLPLFEDSVLVPYSRVKKLVLVERGRMYCVFMN